MNAAEVNQLLEYAQALDNRKITPVMIQAWLDVLGSLDFETARLATIEARKAETITWLEPKHVLKYARPFLERRQVETERAATLQEIQNRTSSAMPKCKHGLGLLYCLPCCKSVANTR